MVSPTSFAQKQRVRPTPRLHNTKEHLGMPTNSYLRIGQAAQLAGVSIDTLRRWEREGKLAAARALGGQRSYLVADIENLRDSGEDADGDASIDAHEAVSSSPRTASTPVPPWKEREANAGADLTVTKLRIDQREEIRRYNEAEQRRFDAQCAEEDRQEEEARARAEQEAERSRKYDALGKSLRSIRSQLGWETAAVRAEVERFLADNATVGVSIPWIEAEAQAILDRHQAERQAEAQREREAGYKQLQVAAQQMADAIRLGMLLRYGNSFAAKRTADREVWDADIAEEALQEVRDHRSEVVKPEWTEKRVEHEVTDTLAQWE